MLRKKMFLKQERRKEKRGKSKRKKKKKKINFDKAILKKPDWREE